MIIFFGCFVFSPLFRFDGFRPLLYRPIGHILRVLTSDVLCIRVLKVGGDLIIFFVYLMEGT